jgi:hypothetical protein
MLSGGDNDGFGVVYTIYPKGLLSKNAVHFKWPSFMLNGRFSTMLSE